MGSVNKVILVGNLGRDAELRYTPGGAAVATLNLATTEVWNDKGGQRLGLLAPQVDVVPLGALLPLAALVVPHFGGGEAELGNGSAARRVAQLGVAAEIADQNYFIDRSHRTTILPQRW